MVGNSTTDKSEAAGKPNLAGKSSGNTNGPLSYGWLSLGVGKGIKWTLWSTNVVLSRQEKQGDRWLTTEELHLAPKILKEIAWRTGHWLASIENSGKNARKKTGKNG